MYTGIIVLTVGVIALLLMTQWWAWALAALTCAVTAITCVLSGSIIGAVAAICGMLFCWFATAAVIDED